MEVLAGNIHVHVLPGLYTRWNSNLACTVELPRYLHSPNTGRPRDWERGHETGHERMSMNEEPFDKPLVRDAQVLHRFLSAELDHCGVFSSGMRIRRPITASHPGATNQTSSPKSLSLAINDATRSSVISA